MSVISELAEGAGKGLFSGIGSLVKDLRTAITGVDPEKRAELEAKLVEFENAILLAQSEVNKVEAASANLFVSGWRPAAGWCCVLALFWYYFLAPFLLFALTVLGIDVTLPAFEAGELITLLFGMLGLGGMRSWEKMKK
jgi:hypothetical protein